MKYLLIIVMIIFLGSCAHPHDVEKHHHHKDLSSIPSKDHGNGKFTIEHGGETFYFDTEADFLKFEDKLKREKARTKCIRKGRQLVCGGQ